MQPPPPHRHPGPGPLPIVILLLVVALAAVTLTPARPAAAAPAKPVLYLTFDDGPGQHTGAFLDLLDRHDVPATFFVVGSAVAGAPEVAARIVADGHAIANHSWSHPPLSSLSDAAIRSQFLRTTAVIESATGVTPVCYRPPFGATNGRVHAQAVLAGLPNAQWTTGNGSHLGLWDVDTNDWRLSLRSSGWSEGAMRARLDAAGDGDTVLLHDGPRNRGRGLRVLAGWLADNHDRFEFRTLPGCGGGPQPVVEPARDPDNAESWHRARIARLYLAYFDRLPDAEGWEYWNREFASGVGMAEISAWFAVSSEFTGSGTPTDQEFVTHVYRTVLDREPDPEGFGYWLGQLDGSSPDGSIDRGELVILFSDSAEFVARSAPMLTGDCYQGEPIEAYRCWTAGLPAYDW